MNSMKLLLEAMKTQFTSGGWSELITEVKAIAQRNHNNGVIVKFLDRWNVSLDSLLKGEAFPIHAAVNMANKENLESLIKTFGVNERDANGETALHLAARNGLENILEFLLANGANASIQSRAAQTALDVAVKNGHLKSARLLGLEETKPAQIPIDENFFY